MSPAGRRNVRTLRIPGRVLRGVVGLIVLSFLNLAAAFITLAALGGLGAWSPAQFVGVFGLFEAGTGLAALFAPNAWRLPVVAASAARPVRLTTDSLLTPHWGAVVKVGVGIAMLGAAGVSVGTGRGTVLLVPVVLGVATAVLGLSLLVARFGVQRPDLDVLELVVRRPRRADRPLRAISLSAVVVQMLITLGPLPSVKLLPPDVLYSPAIEPSIALVVASVLAGLALSAAALLAWRDRLARHAPTEQAAIEAAPEL